MATCKLDISTSPTFRRDLKRLRKKFRDIDEGLQSLKKRIEADYSVVCVFLEDLSTLYAVWCYHRPNADIVKVDDILPLIVKLKHALLNPISDLDEDDEAATTVGH